MIRRRLSATCTLNIDQVSYGLDLALPTINQDYILRNGQTCQFKVTFPQGRLLDPYLLSANKSFRPWQISHLQVGAGYILDYQFTSPAVRLQYFLTNSTIPKRASRGEAYLLDAATGATVKLTVFNAPAQFISQKLNYSDKLTKTSALLTKASSLVDELEARYLSEIDKSLPSRSWRQNPSNWTKGD